MPYRIRRRLKSAAAVGDARRLRRGDLFLGTPVPPLGAGGAVQAHPAAARQPGAPVPGPPVPARQVEDARRHADTAVADRGVGRSVQQCEIFGLPSMNHICTST